MSYSIQELSNYLIELCEAEENFNECVKKYAKMNNLNYLNPHEVMSHLINELISIDKSYAIENIKFAAMNYLYDRFM